MNLKEMKEFLNGLPEEFDEYYVINGEVGIKEGEDGGEDMVYRCDKPVISIFIDEEGGEVCLLHQTREDVALIYDFEEEEKKDDGDTEEDKG